MITGFIAAFVIAFIIVLVLYSGVKKWRSHLGGTAVFLSFFITCIATGYLTGPILISIAGGGIILLLGYLNGIKKLSSKMNFVGQLTAALPFLFIDARVTDLFGIHLGVGAIPATLFLLVGVASVTNRMVNMEKGLSALVLIVLITITYTGLDGAKEVVGPAAALGGSILGFLVGHYLNPRFVMGDAGRMFVGYMLAALSILAFEIKWVVLYLHLVLIITAFYRRRTT